MGKNNPIVVNHKLDITMRSTVEYSLWGETIVLHCANYLGNAIVKSIERTEDGQLKVHYGEKESEPMYISYKGFLTEEERVEDPAQAWNALTVGASTYLTTVDSSFLDGYRPVAGNGDISPFSATSRIWSSNWPIKPEILCAMCAAIASAMLRSSSTISIRYSISNSRLLISVNSLA